MVGAPVLKEVFYRGFLLGELRRTMRPRWAVIAQGVIFGLSHSLRGPYSVAWTAVTGVLFGLPRLLGRPPNEPHGAAGTRRTATGGGGSAGGAGCPASPRMALRRGQAVLHPGDSRSRRP
ncbi:MAG: CPBP family intramembrane metalloprotease [Planctomycetota bacterium]|nr:MAG: CPBP family intramembrane metalloprotease [Planctomycetota bacterium]